MAVGFPKEWILVAAAALLTGYLLGSFYPVAQPRSLQVGANAVEPVFSPGANVPVIAFIDGAQETLDIELYQFSYPALKEALVRAEDRGVSVRLILEPRVESNFETAA